VERVVSVRKPGEDFLETLDEVPLLLEEEVGGGGCKGYETLHKNIYHKCFEKLPSPFGRRAGDEG
jgi:hypothetical protein